MSGGGTFNVSRDLWDDDLFPPEEFSRREAWLWLIAEASWKGRTRNVGGKVVTLERGQLLAPSRFLAKAWGWAEPKVRRFLDRLENRRAIERVTDAGVTVVTICNYDRYQPTPRVTDAETTRGPTRDRRATDANEKKGEIRLSKGATPPAQRPADPDGFADLWEAYPHRGGAKKGRSAAARAYARALAGGASPATLVEAARRYHQDAQVRRGFAKDVATWLNQRCWEDEPEPERAQSRVGPQLATVGGRRGEWTAMGFIPED